jgi:transketolase N-terminal domain/subunit
MAYFGSKGHAAAILYRNMRKKNLAEYREIKSEKTREQRLTQRRSKTAKTPNKQHSKEGN